MVACDFDLHFVYVRAGWEGSASDARVLQDSLDNDFEVPQGKYYLVDAGYENTQFHCTLPQYKISHKRARAKSREA